jgi:hypothetical protein
MLACPLVNHRDDEAPEDDLDPAGSSIEHEDVDAPDEGRGLADDEGEDEDEEDSDEDDDEEDSDEDDDEDEGQMPAPITARRRRAPSPASMAVTCIVLAVGAAYALNCWVNVQAAEDVRLRCGIAEERVEMSISDLHDQPLFAADWMMSLHRARRIYLREICGGTLDQLAWWRWNVFRTITVRLSPGAQQDVERILVRASSSCESEIRDYESALQREMESNPVESKVKTMVREMVAWQYDSCRDLGQAVQGGFWPPLIASGPSEVPRALARILPDSSRPSEGTSHVQ